MGATARRNGIMWGENNLSSGTLRDNGIDFTINMFRAEENVSSDSPHNDLRIIHC